MPDKLTLRTQLSSEYIRIGAGLGRGAKGGAVVTKAVAGQGSRWNDLHKRYVGDIATADLLTVSRGSNCLHCNPPMWRVREDDSMI